MKKKLLLIAFFALFCLQGFAQATAYPVPDLSLCANSGVFDLTVQNPIALGNQSATDYTVTYYHTEANAQAGTNAIANPVAYYATATDEIFLKVTNNATGDFDITSFNISWTAIFTPWASVTVCQSYELPTISWPAITFYTGPNATGTVVPGGTVITSTQTIYGVQTGICSNEWPFTITVAGSLPDVNFDPISVCDADFDGFAVFYLEAHLSDLWSLYSGYPDINIQLYETQADAENDVNQIWDYVYTNTIPNQQTIYVKITAQDCVSIEPLVLIAEPCVTDNTIAGIIRYDGDDNGCTDADVAASNITVYYTNNNNHYFTTTDANGAYSFLNVPDGDITVYAHTSYPFTTTVAPQNYSFTFPGNEEEVNFCLTEQQTTIDASVYTYAYTSFVPGFTATYVIAVQNTGSAVVPSGNVTLSFDADKLTYTYSNYAATLSGNQLSFAYNNLLPFQTQYIYVNFTVATTAVLGDLLAFEATVSPLDDENPDNNTCTATTTVVSSFDPNDITVREGEFITEEQADDYLHYTIRFQNMGTANATFVRIETLLNENLDFDTFQPMGGSHNFVTNRVGTSLEFFFDDINLAFEDADEPASHGFVNFKIKPKATVALGDEMTAQANIYFDFNPLVATNTAITTVQNVASVKNINANSFVLYPNPASGRVVLQMQNAVNATVTITDVLGKTVQTSAINGAQANLDVAALKTGVYLVTINANESNTSKKLVIK